MHIARASNAPHHKTLLRSGAARATPVCRHRQWHSGLTATPVMTMRWRSCSLRSTQVRPVPFFSRVLACARGARCARWRHRPCRQRGLRSNTPSVWRPAPRLRAPVCATRCEGRQEDAGRPRPLTRLPVRTHAHARARRTSSGCELLGVSTVAGNQTVDKTTANALRVLHAAGRSDVKVRARKRASLLPVWRCVFCASCALAGDGRCCAPVAPAAAARGAM